MGRRSGTEIKWRLLALLTASMIGMAAVVGVVYWKEIRFFINIIDLAIRNPVKEARNAISARDFRLYVYFGFAPYYPGVWCYELFQIMNPEMTKQGDGPFDIKRSGARGHYYERYRKFAHAYNREIVLSPHFPFPHICQTGRFTRGEGIRPDTVPDTPENRSIQEQLHSENPHAAAFLDRSDLLKRLIPVTREVDERDELGLTSLQYAIRGKRQQTAALLLSLGASHNVRDLFNRTPLIVASRYGDIELVKMLVDAGADVNANISREPIRRDSRSGLGSAIELADEYGHGDVVDYLREAGANTLCLDLPMDTPFRLLCCRNYKSSLWGDFGNVRKVISSCDGD